MSSIFSIKDQIKQSIDIVEVVGESVLLQQAGRIYKGLCPFHDDHNPSFTVDPDRQLFKCWACGKGGDVFSFVQEKERVDFAEALRMLAKRAGIRLSSTPQRPQTDKTLYYEAMAWAEQQFHQCLLESPLAHPAREYLSRRGFHEETIRQFTLGYHPNDWEWLCHRAHGTRLTPQVLERVGLIRRREGREGYYDRFVHRVMFPIRDVQARTVAFGGRVLPGDHTRETPKYLNSPETPLFTKSELLYGLELARTALTQSGVAVVVEGYTDCIMAHQHGMRNVVAPLGTALTHRHARLLKRYVPKVVLVFDGDEAGLQAAQRAVTLFIANDLDVRVCSLAPGQDPCDLLQQQGAEGFQKLLEQAPDAMKSYVARLQEQFDLTHTQGRYQAAQAFAQLIAQAPRVTHLYDRDRRTREWFAKDTVIRAIGISEKTLEELIGECRKPNARGRSRSAPPANDPERTTPLLSELDPLERELIELVLEDPICLAPIRAEVSPNALTNPSLRALLTKCFELAEQGQRPTYQRLIADVEDLELKRLLTELTSAEHKGDLRERMEGALQAWRRRHHKRQGAMLRQELNDSSSEFQDQLELLRRLDQNKRLQQQLG